MSNSPTGRPRTGIAVVVCVHTAARIAMIRRCLASVVAQLDGDRDELVVVVDHEDSLHRILRGEQPTATVVANTGTRGLSTARNTGVAASSAPVVVFLDDDAVPRADWLARWRDVFTDPATVMAGGAVVARWTTGTAPRWFPEEFGWVVGCDYRGIPASGAAIRNPIGANMAVRRRALDRAGGFSPDLGRVGGWPAGCEETELGIRVRRIHGPGSVVRHTGPVVDHEVGTQRRQLRYFVHRCVQEGRSKARLAAAVGTGDALSSEWRFVLRPLSTGFVRHVGSVVRADLGGPLRGAALVLGLGATTAGFLSGRRAATRAPTRSPGSRATRAARWRRRS